MKQILKECDYKILPNAALAMENFCILDTSIAFSYEKLTVVNILMGVDFSLKYSAGGGCQGKWLES